jgi:hypothetical protein
MIRVFSSNNYKWEFNTETGLFRRWGKTKNDDPQYSPIGPEILDIEVSTICHQGCKFCYKSNTAVGKNMLFKDFKIILDKMRTNLTQVAFGIGDLNANPDLRRMMEYCKLTGIVPNITINGSGISYDWINYLSKTCGAVSVSHYNDDLCYGTVKLLTDAGLKQVNIHQLLSYETRQQCHSLIKDINEDPRLKNLNAVVFLSLKCEGRGMLYKRILDVDFEILVDSLFKEKINFGFDSCTAIKFMKYINTHTEYSGLKQLVEPCESTLFSSYVNVDSKFFPCSFTEGAGLGGIDVIHCKDFIKDIWYNPKTIAWREHLLLCKRNCPVYFI